MNNLNLRSELTSANSLLVGGLSRLKVIWWSCTKQCLRLGLIDLARGNLISLGSRDLIRFLKIKNLVKMMLWPDFKGYCYVHTIIRT